MAAVNFSRQPVWRNYEHGNLGELIGKHESSFSKKKKLTPEEQQEQKARIKQLIDARREQIASLFKQEKEMQAQIFKGIMRLMTPSELFEKRVVLSNIEEDEPQPFQLDLEDEGDEGDDDAHGIMASIRRNKQLLQPQESGRGLLTPAPIRQQPVASSQEPAQGK